MTAAGLAARVRRLDELSPGHRSRVSTPHAHGNQAVLYWMRRLVNDQQANVVEGTLPTLEEIASLTPGQAVSLTG